MKKNLLLYAMIGAAFVLGGCANQTTPATNTAQARVNASGGLVDTGSVSPVSGSGASRLNTPHSEP